jgi:CheY-like chemotaxis protein
MTVHERTILVAGGDAEGQACLAAPVVAAGYAVAVANGADAPTLVSRTDADAVVLDVTRLAPEAAVAWCGRCGP